MPVHITGSFPFPLHRALREKKYAQMFVEEGIFLFHPLAYYNRIEDINRKDKDEGEGRVVIEKSRPVLTLDQKSGKILSQKDEVGPVYFGTSSINPRYILCFSGPQVDIKYLSHKYGRYIISLSHPTKFVNEVAAYLENRLDLPKVMWLDCIQVRYDKDLLVSELPEPASEERIAMSYGQKGPIFSRECEYRLVLTLPFTGNKSPQEVRVELNKKLDYAEIIKDTK